MASPTASRQLVARPEMRWIAVWARAVIVPAYRRALGAWVGCAIASAVIFGPTAMHPSDLTGLALHRPGVFAVLAGIWMLIFLPTARMIMRPPAAYLASLPGAPALAAVLSVVALLGLQLPWLLLWLWGEGMAGAAAVVATTVPTMVIARWRPWTRPAAPPLWRAPGRALLGIQLRALRRRAGDAMLRGAGLALLAGAAAGFPVRNNELSGEQAGVLATSIMSVVLVPAQLGASLVALTAHRESTWLATSLGISPALRRAALVAAIALVHLAASVLAIVAAAAICGAEPWLLLALPVAVGTAFGEVRAMLVHEASPTVASRVVVGAIVIGAVAILALSVLGGLGALALLAVGAVALGTVAAP